MGISKVAIIGFGKVGKVLARALRTIGVDVVINKRITSREFKFCESVRDLPDEVETLFLCVRDRVIPSLIPEIISWRLKFKDSERVEIKPYSLVVAHTAGALSAEILAPLRAIGCAVMAWHPIQTFTGDENLGLFKGITFGISGDKKALKIGEDLAKRLGGIALRISDDKRAIYHLGAVFACNFLSDLVGISVDLMKDAGITERDALKAIQPLLIATINNISHKGLPTAITGPLSRGDVSTIKKHLEILKNYPEIDKLYRLLSLDLIRRLDEKDSNGELLKLLKDHNDT